MSTNMFLKFSDPIKGESSDAAHADHIEITAWGHSFEQPASNFRSSTGSTIEKCKHELVTCTKYIDKATPEILKAIWAGKQIDDATILCYRASKDNTPILYLKIEMKEVIISTYGISGGEGDIPAEELGLAYGKVTYYYTAMDKVTGDASGSDKNLSASWDMSKNNPGE